MTVEKIITVEFYDGAVSGFCQIMENNQAESYCYELISQDCQDDGEDTRIFGLAPMPNEVFNTVTRLFAAASAPTWPFWVPGVITESVHLEVDRIKGQTSPISRLIMADCYMKNVRAVAVVSDTVRAKLPSVLPCYEYSAFDYWRSVFLEDKPG